MARLIVSAVVGVAVGYLFGPQAGFQAFALTYGVSAGLDPNKKVLGPRLDDLKGPKASYGAPIAYIEGAPRLAGNYIWASAKREVATTTTTGGKGGPGVDSTAFTYEMDVIVELAINQCAAVRRVWSNGKLVFNKGDDADGATLIASATTNTWRDLRFYGGGATQLPDPTYEAAVGIGNAPAYRGRTTVVIEGLNLGGSGQLPVLTFEVLSQAAQTLATADLATYTVQNIVLTGIPAMSTAGFKLLKGILDPAYPAEIRLANVEVYDVAADGTLALSSSFPAPVNSSSFFVAATATGNSDVSCIVLYTTDSHLLVAYADGSYCNVDVSFGGVGGRGSFSKAGGNAVFAIVGGALSNSTIFHFNPISGAVFHTYSVPGRVPIGSVAVDAVGGFAYALISAGTTIYKFDLATFTLQASIAPPTGSTDTQASIVCDAAGTLRWISASTGGGSMYSWTGSAWTLALSGIGGAGGAPGNSASDSYSFFGGVLLGQRYTNSDGTGAHFHIRYVSSKTAIVPPTLDQVVRRLCLRTGLLTDADIDVTDLASGVAIAGGLVRAMAVSQVSTTRATIETLMSAYLFECVEGATLRFVKRGGASALTIPYKDLGAGKDEKAEPLPLKRSNDIEIAARVSVKYANTLNDFQDGLEAADRLVTASRAEHITELPLGFQPAEAKMIADANTLDLAVSLMQIGPITLSHKYAALEPTDVVTLTDSLGSTFRARIMQTKVDTGITTLDLVLDDATVVNSAALTDSGYATSTLLSVLTNTNLILLDIPILRDTDNAPGFYAAFGSDGTWPGAELDKSADNVTYAKILNCNDRDVAGTTATALGNFTGGGVFDEINALTVNVGAGVLTSLTRDALLSGSGNTLAVGAPGGNWEVIRFRDAAFVSAGVYTLTGFLRGQLGTEWAIPGHTATERVVLLQTSGIRRVTEVAASIGIPNYWKAVTFGKSRAAAAALTFTDTGVGLKPYAVANLSVVNSGVQDLQLGWYRRSRLSSRLFGAAPPLGEASELYSVDVFAGAALLRTASVTSTSFVYTAAMQAADGVTSSTALTFRVYQISATVGRGYAASTAATGRRAPLPQIGTVTIGGTFASGAALFVVLGSKRFAYTSTVGDATLNGIAASIATLIAVDTTRTATAAGAVVTITGPVSVTESFSAGQDPGDNVLAFGVTQTASPVVVGHREEFNFGWAFNSGNDGYTTGSFTGAVYTLRVVRSSDGMARTYQTTSTQPGTRELPYIHNSLYGAFISSGDRAAFDLDITPDPLGLQSTFFSPLTDPNWDVQVFCSDPRITDLVGRRGVGVAAVPVARPQITKLTLAGTPVTGRVYRAILGGVSYDYTALVTDTTMTLVAAGLAPVIDAAAAYIATNTGPVITITGAVANVPFLFSGTVIVSTVTATAVVTQTAS